VVRTVDQRLLQVADLNGRALDRCWLKAEEFPLSDCRDAVRDAVDFSALRSGRRGDIHRPGNLFGQSVVAEGAVVADVHRLGDVGSDEVLVGGVHGLLAGSEWNDEICAREEPVEPALLGEPGGDLAGGVWGDLQRRLDVVDGDDLVTRASESCKESTFSSREALAYIL